MHETIVAEITATLAALKSAGEMGFWIIAVCLLVVILVAVVVLINQWIVINRFKLTAKSTEEKLKGVDIQLKSIDTRIKERELGVKERDELRGIFSQQFSIVKETNSELRIELTRLSGRQDKFEDSVRQSITVGLQDIKNRLTQISVKEIMAQVPEDFRKDIEAEFYKSLKDAVERMNGRLNDEDLLKSYIQNMINGIRNDFSSMFRNHLESMIQNHFGSIHPSFISKWVYQTVREEGGDNYLARKLAARFERGEYIKHP